MAYDASVNAGIDPGLYQRVIQHGEQSLSDPNAVSRKGARGPAQLTAATANEVGVQDINDPQQNIAGGARYLAKMLQRYNGDVMRAVAAYNAGPEAVDSGNWVTYPETVKYVHRVLGIAVSPTPTTSAPPSPALQLPADAFRMSY
jgi:soluble lytic murein transglycosylase-like protein